LGYTPFTFEPEYSDFTSRIHPDDITFVKKYFDEFFKNPKPGSFEFRIILPDGTIKWLLNSFLPIFVNGRLQTIKGINLDITDRKKSDVNLRKLSRAVDQSPLAIVITNLDAEIEYANPKFTEITGYELEEVIGANPRILQSNYHNSEYYKNIWDTLLQGDVWQGEILNRKKTGETYWESMVIAPVSDDKGVTTNYIAIKEDITEKIRLQNELINAKNRAEESDKLKSAFLANMSHEIRTPMNGIMGFSRMLGSGDLTDAEREEFAEILNSSCNRLINTVNDILDISKIEANQMDVRISNFSIISLFEELRTAYIDTNSKSEVQFITKLNNIPESFSMYSDEQKVFQILNNLVSNAFKFTNEGSIELGGRLLENKIEFYVSDTGIGISEDAMSMIFGRFYQADSSLSRGYEGTGLGLAICRGMIELLGGSISVESQLGTGSIFRIELPLN
jgi:PAS domain S-box-containing protein